jgi:hypothetical protein
MTTIRLATIGCPAEGCGLEDRTRIIYWNHSCGSKAYLDRYANIHCYFCGVKWPILESKFNCEYSEITKFIQPNVNLSRLTRSLAVLSTMEFDNVRKDISSFTEHEFSVFLDSVDDNLHYLH